MSATTADATERTPRHPRQALSRATTTRLLQQMLTRAEAGDNDAAQRLIEMAQRRTAPATEP